MRIEESVLKNQRRIDSGKDVVVGMNKYWINEDDGNGGDGIRDGNKKGEDTAEALRIDNAAVRESWIRRLG